MFKFSLYSISFLCTSLKACEHGQNKAKRLGVSNNGCFSVRCMFVPSLIVFLVSCCVSKTESGGYCLQSDDARYTPGPNGVKPLSPEQEELIHRLVYFQNEYEQPSEEDLKRIEVRFLTSVVHSSTHTL